jgi:excinuclease ABC subunit A
MSRMLVLQMAGGDEPEHDPRTASLGEIARRATGSTLHMIDKPTTGQDFDDTRKFLGVLHTLAERGNTVVVIEHHLDVHLAGERAGARGGPQNHRLKPRRAGGGCAMPWAEGARRSPTKTADWVIDLGPERGDESGRVAAQGTPENAAQTPARTSPRSSAHREPRRAEPTARSSECRNEAPVGAVESAQRLRREGW